jgi:glycosyltransferase involved in cell wall biosynthesis
VHDADEGRTPAPRIAVLLPCRDEERSIARVVADFRAALPAATIHVYDNGSSDGTVARALDAGALVANEARRGKGNVVCRMFADVDADVYVLADGDGTYDASAAPDMIDRLVRDRLDMVVGCRSAIGDDDAYPRGHVMGNWLFNRLFRMLFGMTFTDVFSGYRVMSRRFVKSFPVRFPGFEIETELAAHAVDIGLPYAEVVTAYRSREAGSERKLRTISDGSRIAIVLRLPTAVLAASVQIIAFICLTAGLVLDSVCRSRREARRLVYLSLPPVPRYTDERASTADRVDAPASSDPR